MKPVALSPEQFAAWCEQRPALVDDMADAFIEVREDGARVYDQDHKAWAAAVKRGNASRGLGDTVEKITKALHLKTCSKCRRRRDKLNRLFPYRATSQRT